MLRMGDTYMDEIFESDDEIDKHENNKSGMTIQMSEIFTKSMCDLKTTKVRNYLNSFSQNNVQREKKLPCLKQKYKKKCNLHQYMNPYYINESYDKYNEPRSHFSNNSIHIQSQFYSLEHKKKKKTDNSRSLQVKNPSETLNITLKPIVLMHVRDIPAEFKPKERSHLSHSQSSKLKTGSNGFPVDFESLLRVCHANKKQSKANVLRVKSSCNFTDLSFERKMSSMTTIGDTLVPPENFRRPNNRSCYICRSCCKSKMSPSNSSSFSRVCLDQDSNSELKYFLDSFSGERNDDKDIARVCANELKKDYSDQKDFQRPVLRNLVPRTSAPETSGVPRNSVGRFQGMTPEQFIMEQKADKND